MDGSLRWNTKSSYGYPRKKWVALRRLKRMSRLDEEIRCIQNSINIKKWILRNNILLNNQQRDNIRDDIKVLKQDLEERLKEIRWRDWTWISKENQ